MSQLPEQHKSLSSLSLQVELNDDDAYDKEEQGVAIDGPPPVPSICGLPLKYVS